MVRLRPHRDTVLYEYQSKQSSTSSLVTSRSAPLLGIDVPARPNLDPPMPAGPLPSDQVWQVILVHEVPLSLPAVLVGAALVLALVLGEDEVLAPMALAAALHARHLAVGGTVHRLGDAVHVAALVVLEVALEVQLHLARAVGAAARPRQRRLPALGAELLVHLTRHVKAPVAAQHPCLELLDAAEVGGGDEAGAESQSGSIHAGYTGPEGFTYKRFIRNATFCMAKSEVSRAACRVVSIVSEGVET